MITAQTCLVVDDSRVVRRVARRMLEAYGFAVEEAENGAQALAACMRRLPDCVLLDRTMPVMDGAEFLRQSRAQFGAGRPPVVVCAASNEMASVEEAIAHGARDYIMKPFEEDVLLGKLAQAAAPAAGRAARPAASSGPAFFADERAFAHLRAKALPRLLDNVATERRPRIWCAAAATGQVAYSLAMSLAELAGGTSDVPTEIVATDTAPDQLARAREGLYTQSEIQRGLPPRMLVRYFHAAGNRWRIGQPIRQMVRFRAWNLLSDPRPLGLFDIVFCRDALADFDRPTKTRVLEAIARRMRPGGLLYLGRAESIRGLTDRFAPVPGECGIHALAEKATPGQIAWSQPGGVDAGRAARERATLR